MLVKLTEKPLQDKQATGKLGEKLAAAYLEQHGYTVVAQNYRQGRAEIDLIATKGRLLLFVEVKSRTGSNQFGYPEEAVDAKKAARIVRAADAYIAKANWKGTIRFDIIAVQFSGRAQAVPELHHFEDAFY